MGHDEVMAGLSARIDALLKDYVGLKGRVAFLEQQTSLLQEQNKALREQIEQAKAARSIALTGGDIQETRRQVNSMIQEIDRCIALLNSVE